MVTNIILEAAAFARKMHAGQYRIYNRRPYFEHVARIAGLTAMEEGMTENDVAAAYLHDTVEDTDTTLRSLERQFNGIVAARVSELTSYSKKITYVRNRQRRERKRLDINYLKHVSPQAKKIKLIDRTDNLRELVGAPWTFVHMYVKESRELAIAIGDVSMELTRKLVLECLRLDLLYAEQSPLSKAFVYIAINK